MRFWDASAVVPLLLPAPAADPLFAFLKADPDMLVWWGTLVECASALARREREAGLAGADAARAWDALRSLSRQWQEVLPAESIRIAARRLLRVHALRAADALQLGAALVGADGDPAGLAFVSLDLRLAEAAHREGFAVPAIGT